MGQRGIPITSGDPPTGNALYAQATTTDEIAMSNPETLSQMQKYFDKHLEAS